MWAVQKDYSVTDNDWSLRCVKQTETIHVKLTTATKLQSTNSVPIGDHLLML